VGTFVETAIFGYRLSLPTKENELPLSIFVCSKEMDVCHFRFLFAANTRKSPFSVSSIFRMCVNPFNVCSSCERMFVVCSFIGEVTTNRIYPFANGLAHLCKYDI
jgi:hypothetical protein